MLETRDLKEHWNRIYQEKLPTQLGWFQGKPTLSLNTIDALGLPEDSPVVDVGAGASRLVDELMERGFKDLTVLDISREALSRSREYLGSKADRVNWVEADIMAWEAGKSFTLWHDRAVFHYLTAAHDRKNYRNVLKQNLKSGGYLILAALSLDGPQPPRGDGLDVRRYSPELLLEEFGESFQLLATQKENHLSPSGKIFPFIYALFRKSSKHLNQILPEGVPI